MISQFSRISVTYDQCQFSHISVTYDQSQFSHISVTYDQNQFQRFFASSCKHSSDAQTALAVHMEKKDARHRPTVFKDIPQSSLSEYANAFYNNSLSERSTVSTNLSPRRHFT